MAIKFEKIKEGMTLWDVRRNTGQLRFSKWLTWSVKVHKVDTEKRQVLASWNNNKSNWMPERRVTKFRARLPKEDK